MHSSTSLKVIYMYPILNEEIMNCSNNSLVDALDIINSIINNSSIKHTKTEVMLIEAQTC